MGDFKLEIYAFSNHGIDRSKKDGEKIDYIIKDGLGSDDYIFKAFVDSLKEKNIQVISATITHWPQDKYEGRKSSGPVDDFNNWYIKR